MSANREAGRLERAAAWRVRLTESGGARVPELADWLAEDPANLRAWKAVQTPWQLLGDHAACPDMITRRRAALAAAPRSSHAGAGRGWRRRSQALAALILVSAGAAILFWQTHRFDIYRTGSGERRVVTLADGSQITLDARSEVAVRYTVHSRQLELERGQARFDVAHDVERPFTVAVDGHKVVATGTAFDVDLLGADLRVTLIKGHVVVLPQDAPTRPYQAASMRAASAAPAGGGGAATPADWSRIVLDPGEQLLMAAGRAPRVDHVNLQRVTAWEHGQLAFKNDPLSAVVARMNRYGSNPIVIGDAQAAHLRISGVFHEGDSAGFVSTVTTYLPVRARSGRGGSIILDYDR